MEGGTQILIPGEELEGQTWSSGWIDPVARGPKSWPENSLWPVLPLNGEKRSGTWKIV